MPKQKKAPKKQESVSDAERIAKGQILARIIIEVLGAPKEHVEEAIKLVVDKIRDSKEMDDLIQFMFNFTPSSVEIVRPTQLSIPALHLNGLFNDFLLKMHDLGLKMKDTSASMQLLKKNTDVLIRNFLNFVLKEPRSSEEVSKLTGIPKENVSALLANFEKAGIVERQGDSYVLRSEKERKGKNV
jgi:hypothetical protein